MQTAIFGNCKAGSIQVDQTNLVEITGLVGRHPLEQLMVCPVHPPSPLNVTDQGAGFIIDRQWQNRGVEGPSVRADNLHGSGDMTDEGPGVVVNEAIIAQGSDGPRW